MGRAHGVPVILAPPSSRDRPFDVALASPPSRAAWRSLSELLDAFEPEELDASLRGLEERLAAWPDHLRTVPGRWLATLLEGENEPRLELTRTLDHVLMLEPERSFRFAWTETSRLQRLSTVRLHDEGFGDDGARSLAKSTTLASLTELSIGAHIGPAGATKLLAAPILHGVRTLGLNRNRIGTQGVEALATSPCLPTLEALHLGRNHLDDDALRVLAGLCAPHLARLDLDFDAFTTAGLAALAASPLLASVFELNLSNNRLTREACEALAASPHLAGLRVLFLHNCGLTDDALDALLASPYLRTLGNLAVSGNELGPASFDALAECAALGSLYELDVCHNRVDPAAAEASLKRSPYLRQLDRLCV